MIEIADCAPVLPMPAPPAGRSIAASSSDGRCLVVSDGEVVRIAGGRALVAARRAVAAAVLERAIWVVTCVRGEHVLRCFDRGGAGAGALALGALGEDVRIAATRKGPGLALIEGDRGVVVREQPGGLAVETLGERGRDRRVLLGGRGVIERRVHALALRRSATAPLLALPSDLAGGAIGAGSVVLGSVVLDGAAALIEVVVCDRATALIYDLRGGGLRTRIRLGGARILAVAEHAGIAVLGAGAHVALLDVRAGHCIGARILAGPVAATAIDAAGERVVCVGADGKVSELGRSMTDLSPP